MHRMDECCRQERAAPQGPPPPPPQLQARAERQASRETFHVTSHVRAHTLSRKPCAGRPLREYTMRIGARSRHPKRIFPTACKVWASRTRKVTTRLEARCRWGTLTFNRIGQGARLAWQRGGVEEVAAPTPRSPRAAKRERKYWQTLARTCRGGKPGARRKYDVPHGRQPGGGRRGLRRERCEPFASSRPLNAAATLANRSAHLSQCRQPIGTPLDGNGTAASAAWVREARAVCCSFGSSNYTRATLGEA